MRRCCDVATGSYSTHKLELQNSQYGVCLKMYENVGKTPIYPLNHRFLTKLATLKDGQPQQPPEKTTVSHVQTRPNLRPKAVTPCPPCEMAPLWEIRLRSSTSRDETGRIRTTLPPGSTVLNRLAQYIYIHLIYNDIYIYICIYIYIYMLYVICYMTCLDVYNDMYIYIYTCYMLYDLSRWDMTVCVLHHHIWQFFVRSFHCSWSVNIPTCDSDCHLVSPHQHDQGPNMIRNT